MMRIHRSESRAWPSARLRQITSVACVALLLFGCGSTPATHFHTLMAEVPPPNAAAAPTASTAAPSATTASAAATSSADFAWELLPVTIPAQLDRPQMVLRQSDGSVALAEYERWIAPLADEWHDALAEQLTRALGVSETTYSRRPRWRVHVDVQRMDSMLGRSARLEAEWRVRASEQGGPSLRCTVRYDVAVGPGYAALAAGHRQALAQLAQAIAATLASAREGGAPVCPS